MRVLSNVLFSLIYTENADLVLCIFSSTISRPHDVQNHMIVTIIPDLDWCREVCLCLQ